MNSQFMIGLNLGCPHIIISIDKIKRTVKSIMAKGGGSGK